MINVSIGPARPPATRIGREVPRHVLVYLLLQIDAGAPVRSNDYVGANAAVEGEDGIYLMTMTYASTEPGLNASAPFYFLLHKNAPPAEIIAAVGSLGVASSFVQYVPEPSTASLLAACLATLPALRRSRSWRRRIP